MISQKKPTQAWLSVKTPNLASNKFKNKRSENKKIKVFPSTRPILLPPPRIKTETFAIARTDLKNINKIRWAGNLMSKTACQPSRPSNKSIPVKQKLTTILPSIHRHNHNIKTGIYAGLKSSKNNNPKILSIFINNLSITASKHASVSFNNSPPSRKIENLFQSNSKSTNKYMKLTE